MKSAKADAATHGRSVAPAAESVRHLRLARGGIPLLIGIALAALGAAALAQTATVTPTQGQSAEQVETDKQQCYASAVQGSGYDPATSQAATGGRALGAAAGATAGVAAAEVRGRQHDAYDRIDDDLKRDYRRNDAKSAGAAGAVIGGTKQRRERRETAADAKAFDSAYRACLSGRGYAVQ